MDVPHIVAGRFRIECEIGKGGMGTVYRATQFGLERPVAVKIIKPEFATDQTVAERFMREARTMARLRHPHAAMIFDAGNLPDGRHFIVMEYVEGETLSEVLAREGRFTPERCVRIASDICDVLSEAHRLGIIHRDLKPSNIMLNERGVCVLDFGVAKVLATSAEVTATHATTGSGVIVGTPRYMSPEQCLGQRVGARSDLYSLGVLLYEMLAGQPPFTDPMASAVLVKQATAAPTPLPKLRADLPRPLVLAVHTLLAKQPCDRPANAAAARRLLEQSIARPLREMPESEPFAGTVATMSAGRGIVFRAVMPLFLIAALGTLLFIWGHDALNSPPPPLAQAKLAAAPEAATVAPLPQVAGPLNETPPAPTIEDARRLVNNISADSSDNVRVIQLGSESAIAAIHDERREGTTHLFVMRKRGQSYLVSGRAALDKSDFRGASWTMESMDVEGDGYEELLCWGTSAKSSVAATRYVLYVPRTRQTYSMRIESLKRGDGTRPRVTLSSNAMTAQAAPYRTALLQRTRSATGSF